MNEFCPKTLEDYIKSCYFPPLTFEAPDGSEEKARNAELVTDIDIFE